MTEELTDDEIEKVMKELGISDDPQGAEGIGDFLFLVLMDQKLKDGKHGDSDRSKKDTSSA